MEAKFEAAIKILLAEAETVGRGGDKGAQAIFINRLMEMVGGDKMLFAYLRDCLSVARKNPKMANDTSARALDAAGLWPLIISRCGL